MYDKYYISATNYYQERYIMDKKVYETILTQIDTMRKNFEACNPIPTTVTTIPGESEDETKQRIAVEEKRNELNSIETKLTIVRESCELITRLLINQQNKIK